MGYADVWMILRTPMAVGGLIAAALLLHRLVIFILQRIARRTHTDQDEALLLSVFQPLRWITVCLVLLSAGKLIPLEADNIAIVATAVRIVMPLLWGWLVIAIVRFIHGYVDSRSDIAASNNLTARRRRTRAEILARIATIAVVLVSLGLMLLKIPEVREIGVALMASAGIAGLAFGIAAQPLLKNLVAGIQLVFTEPVRIDDVVVYEGEWGRIEKISLTYVVLKIWDDRRLVIPVARLLEGTIENWTRETSHLLGTVMVYVDPAADVPDIRAFALKTIAAHALWDQRAAGVQVTDMTADVLELRILMSGHNGSELFEMRCDIREAVVGYIAEQIPAALPRNRLSLEPLEPSG